MGPSAPGEGRSLVGASSPQTNLVPDLGSARLNVEPDPVAPAPAGSTQSKLLQAPRSARADGDPQPGGPAIEILPPCWAGWDVHKTTVLACGRRVASDGEVLVQTLNFGTRTAELLALADWLASQGVSPLAMESTGVSWKPVSHILEGQFESLLVNAPHLKPVPGRKTDVTDADGIAQLLQHGSLSPSFGPPPSIRERRDLTRQRTQLVREKATVADRAQKVLEDADIKLAGVARDPLGVSGRALIRGLITGRDDAGALAEKARARRRAKIPQWRPALQGRVTEHHRFLLRMLMDQVEHLEGRIERFDQRIAAALVPFAGAAERRRTIPGLSATSAAVIGAAIGTDLERFPSAGPLASWAGLGPGTDESAGKRRRGRTTKGNQSLRAMRVQVAWAAVHAKGTIFQAQSGRWIKRMGKKKALVAVAPKSVVLISKRLKTATDYRERWIAQPAA
jgi:transposase